jgi:hypothetical protein
MRLQQGVQGLREKQEEGEDEDEEEEEEEEFEEEVDAHVIAGGAPQGTPFTCFTGKKSTNTDAAAPPACQ